MRIALLALALVAGGAARADAPAGRVLDRAAVVRGMTAIAPRLHACAPRTLDPTLAVFHLTIAPTGRVTAATLEPGALDGTPVAACLVRVVRDAAFAPFDGAPVTLAYPVALP